METKCSNDKAIKRKAAFAAMEFSRIVGILETLGDVKEDCFQVHKEEFLDWAGEFAEQQDREHKEELVDFFKRKLEEKNLLNKK